MDKSDSAHLITAHTPEWLLQTAQQIQVIDYELHASIRNITRGEMRREQVSAFMSACITRDRLMAQVISYVAAQRRQSANPPMTPRNGIA